ncbi:MAG: hypothetical protein NC931_01695 [Candidatus Omnitrophica bacterium]|nr:hypothetical protein [Candidatus Omnitrophota bacterium]MCM8829373.1 hypothetical protein [Candidatus Omnitrophota bacterium]
MPDGLILTVLIFGWSQNLVLPEKTYWDKIGFKTGETNDKKTVESRNF